MREISSRDDDRRRFRRVGSLVQSEDVVLVSMNRGSNFAAKLVDLSRGGVLLQTADTAAGEEIDGPYKLYFQSRGQMFHLEGTLVRKRPRLIAFEFVNVTPLDIEELRTKLARMEIMAARVFSDG